MSNLALQYYSEIAFFSQDKNSSSKQAKMGFFFYPCFHQIITIFKAPDALSVVGSIRCARIALISWLEISMKF